MFTVQILRTVPLMFTVQILRTVPLMFSVQILRTVPLMFSVQILRTVPLMFTVQILCESNPTEHELEQRRVNRGSKDRSVLQNYENSENI